MSTRDGPVRRVVRLLDRIAASEDPITVRSLADGVDLPPSTVHRLLQTLHDEGLVVREAERGRYAIGPSWYRISAQVVAKLDLPELARPHLEQVGDASGEACVLGLYLPHEEAMTFVATHESPHPLGYRLTLHDLLPLEWGASGKAILAHLPEETQMRVVTGARTSPVTGQQLDRDRLQRDLARVRTEGYLISHGEKLPGAVGIAAPVFGVGGSVIASLCLTLPESRFDPDDAERLGELVRVGSRQLSRVLGGPDHTAETA